MNKVGEKIFTALQKEGSFFLLLLGMCLMLPVTTTTKNALALGSMVFAVLLIAKLFVLATGIWFPTRIKIPVFMVTIAFLVSLIKILTETFYMPLYQETGQYIPLIVVVCIVLGRAEGYSYTRGFRIALFDALKLGGAYVFGMTFIGLIREFFGLGTIFGYRLMPEFDIFHILTRPAGAFFLLACVAFVWNIIESKRNSVDVSTEPEAEVKEEVE